jgi:AP endonuclease 2
VKGSKIAKLRDVMGVSRSQPQPPRITAKYWEEYSGKQTLLSTFFGRGGTSAASKETAMVGMKEEMVGWRETKK